MGCTGLSDMLQLVERSSTDYTDFTDGKKSMPFLPYLNLGNLRNLWVISRQAKAYRTLDINSRPLRLDAAYQ
jgi:hypothetical protein